MSVEQYERAFPPLLPPDEVFETSRHLLDKCPVTASSVDGGFWVVNTYEDNLRVLKDWETYAVGRADGKGSVRVPADPPGVNRPLFPPIDINPPRHHAFRAIMNPYFTPGALAEHETGFRRIIAGLLDSCTAEGRSEFAGDFAKVFPAQLTFTELFGIEDTNGLAQAQSWIRTLTYDLFRKSPAHLAEAQRELNTWTLKLIESRRGKRSCDNVIDALVQAEIDGQALSDEELIGTIQLLILGGFSTTADATCNLVIALIERPGLEDRLRENPSLIKPFVEEVLRLDPPITARARRCTLSGQRLGDAELGEGDRLVLNFVAANRDPREFAEPDEIDLSRRANRHLSFSGGVHRCVGSTMARMTLNLMLEELFARAKNFRFADGKREERVSFSVGVWRAVDLLPIEFESISR